MPACCFPTSFPQSGADFLAFATTFFVTKKRILLFHIFISSRRLTCTQVAISNYIFCYFYRAGFCFDSGVVKAQTTFAQLESGADLIELSFLYLKTFKRVRLRTLNKYCKGK